MKPQRTGNIFLIYIVLIFLLFLPLTASAAATPWSLTDFEAYAELGGSNTQNSSTPPVTAYISISSSVQSDITSDSMSLLTIPYLVPSGTFRDLEEYALARAEFTGMYTASASSPFFEFTYSTSSSTGSLSSDCNQTYFSKCAWLQVTDVTDNLTLYSEYLLYSGSDSIISVSTTPGHDISVNFGIQQGDAVGSFPSFYQNSSTLSYSLAVVPEPVSSILFLAGGTLLAGRLLKRRRSYERKCRS